MKKLLVVGVGAAAAAIALAPMAHADEQSYIDELAAAGITSTNGPQGLINAGYLVCDDLRKGASYIHETERLIAISAVGAQRGRDTPILTPEQAATIAGKADTDLCPGADGLS